MVTLNTSTAIHTNRSAVRGLKVPLWHSGPGDTFGCVEKTLDISAGPGRQSDSIAPTETMSCAELDSLQKEYDNAVRELTEGAERLHARSGSPASKKAHLLNRTQVKAENARRALRNHIIEHDCC